MRGRSPGSWYLGLAAGIFPLLLAGFAASALANRLAFVGWGLAGAAAYGAVHRYAWGAGWAPALHAAALLACAGGAAFALGLLVERHREPLELGIRALLPALDASRWARPANGYVAGGALLAVAGGFVVADRVNRRGRGGRAP